MDGRTNCVAAGHNRSHYNFIDRLTVKAAIGPVFKLAVNSEGLMDRVAVFPRSGPPEHRAKFRGVLGAPGNHASSALSNSTLMTPL